MKRCPECRRNYYDETLLYCLDDGTALLEGPGSGAHETAILSGDEFADNAKTRPLISSSGSSSNVGATSGNVKTERSLTSKAGFAAAGVLIVAGLVGLGFFISRSRTTPQNNPVTIKLEKVTSQGNTLAAAISPDGKYAVYNVDEGGAQSLWTKQIPTSSTVQIIPPASNVEYASIRFSPEGNFVTFRKRDASSTLFSLYQMPILGGPQKKIATDVDSAVSYSPDGKLIAYLRGNAPEMGESGVVIANPDGSNERIIVKRKRPETFPWWRDGTVAWSPDGLKVAVVIGGSATGSGVMEIAAVDVDSGAIQTISKGGWYEISQIVWLPDETGLLVLGAEKPSDYYSQQISMLSYPSGETRRVTTDFNNYKAMNLTADGKNLAAVQTSRISNIWIVPNGEANRAFQIKSGGTNQDGTDGLAAAPDGRIVFYSKASGADDLWIMNGDGSDVKQLTVDVGTNYDLKVTPDGKYIVFTSERAGQPNIWRMDMDGGNPKQLTFGSSEFGVTVTPDSKWLMFDSPAAGSPSIWKVSIDGGEPIQVIKGFAENSEISPDGKALVCSYRENATAPWKYGIFNIETGDLVETLNVQNSSDDIRWAPDGRAIAFYRMSQAVGNIWRLPVGGGPPTQITDFKNDQIFNFKWSPDGKALVVARGSMISDAVLIRDFR